MLVFVTDNVTVVCKVLEIHRKRPHFDHTCARTEEYIACS